MKKLLLLATLFAFASCDNTVLYNETAEDFKDNRWLATDVKNFEFELARDINAGDIIMKFSHVHDPQFTTIPVEAVITYPSGEKENVALNLELKDKEGNDLSECLGDVCDLFTPLKENSKLSKGKYNIAIRNSFPNIYLPNAITVGISVETDN
ncbi:hypothetical protein OGH69_08670 [Flavobacterium sp. MFBS3-15]|uniref:hypothetical protein n=1 Tax=Flavobacterium sp. MFBS3-15 TaxID=2989816 RepID=UPI0022364BDE|nr:hypothetical protein [Flavobacterium sp. MFBS3-15]MCW4469034.1 hypothetical protein [Flavobacterium sp. MFBS3-15]